MAQLRGATAVRGTPPANSKGDPNASRGWPPRWYQHDQRWPKGARAKQDTIWPRQRNGAW
eukprot:6081050-Alexandrium_andersonii.AAC.1